MKEKFNSFIAGKSITAEQLKAKSAEELAALYNEFNELNSAELSKAIESKASIKDIESLKESIASTQVEQMKSLNETLKQHGLAIKKLSEGEKSAKAEQVTSIRKALEANVEKLKSLGGTDKAAAQNAQFSFETKAVGDMTITGNVSGGNVPVEQRLAGLNTIATRRPKLMDLVSRGTATSNVISWVYQANREGAAGGTAEGATKNQIDFDLVVASESVKKRTVYIKVSTEMLGDIDFMESEIRNELMRLLIKDVETQIYSGDNIGTNLNGIRTVATAFAAGTFALTVDNANEADVLVVAMNQIETAEQMPANYILMHPSDVAKLLLIKVSTTDRRYIDRLVLVAGQLSLDGIPIIKTTLVTVGTYLVGAFDLATVYDRGDVSINVGLDGNDFTKNMRTILAEWRGLVIVKNNDRTAFVKGTFATDKAALETA
jgi:HK97 family phage major capsid protein